MIRNIILTSAFTSQAIGRTQNANLKNTATGQFDAHFQSLAKSAVKIKELEDRKLALTNHLANLGNLNVGKMLNDTGLLETQAGAALNNFATFQGGVHNSFNVAKTEAKNLLSAAKRDHTITGTNMQGYANDFSADYQGAESTLSSPTFIV